MLPAFVYKRRMHYSFLINNCAAGRAAGAKTFLPARRQTRAANRKSGTFEMPRLMIADKAG
jgi:hypothetical protein